MGKFPTIRIIACCAFVELTAAYGYGLDGHLIERKQTVG